MASGSTGCRLGYELAQRWIDNSRARLVTKTANELADQLPDMDLLDWPRTVLGERPN